MRVAAQMKGKGGGESPKAWVNYCSAYSALFMWGEGLVRLPGVGGLQEFKSHLCSKVPKGRHIHITRKS